MQEKTKVLFLHIPKTGGSSIISTAREIFSSGAIMSAIDFATRKGGNVEEVPFVSGHFGYDYAEPLMGSRYSFTFLRDPVERILSLYYFCRRCDPDMYEIFQLAHQYSLDEFLEQGAKGNEEIHKNIWNYSTRMLGNGWQPMTVEPTKMLDLAIRRLRAFSHVGFTETYEDDYKKICAELGWPIRDRAPRVIFYPDRPSKHDISSTTLDLIHQFTVLDRRLYDTAWEELRDARAKCGEPNGRTLIPTAG